MSCKEDTGAHIADKQLFVADLEAAVHDDAAAARLAAQVEGVVVGDNAVPVRDASVEPLRRG